MKKPTEDLTRREVEVLTLLATGASRRAISQLLSLSEETVKEYITRASKRLGAANKTHAVALALALGIITPFNQDRPPSTA